MRNTLIAIFAFCLSNSALADNHSITFKQRQASTKMNITAVQITPTSGTISAEGSMGEYGTTYLTYALTADPDGNGGQVIGEGRGARKDGSFGVGKGAGSYYRDGTKFVMHILFRINDGTQNLDKVVFDAANRTLTHDIYIAK